MEVEAEAEPQTLEQTFGVEGERTLGSFSCELETEHALFPGRLFVFESAAGFYAFAMGHEIAELVPFARVDELSKRNLALFLPHAIDISVAGRTLSLCSFASREEVFTLLKQRWVAAFRSCRPTRAADDSDGARPAALDSGGGSDGRGGKGDGGGGGGAAPAAAAGAAGSDGGGASPETSTVGGADGSSGSAGRSAPVAMPGAHEGGDSQPPQPRRLASSPPNSGTVLTQRLRVATNTVLARAMEKEGALTAADESEPCLRLLVAIEAVLEHGFAARGRFLARRGHFWQLLEQLELIGGAGASGVAAARAAGAAGGDAECAHAWLCWCLNRGRVYQDLSCLLEGSAGGGEGGGGGGGALLHAYYAPCALLRDDLSRSTFLCLLQPLEQVVFRLPLSLQLWPALAQPACPPEQLGPASADANADANGGGRGAAREFDARSDAQRCEAGEHDDAGAVARRQMAEAADAAAEAAFVCAAAAAGGGTPRGARVGGGWTANGGGGGGSAAGREGDGACGLSERDPATLPSSPASAGAAGAAAAHGVEDDTIAQKCCAGEAAGTDGAAGNRLRAQTAAAPGGGAGGGLAAATLAEAEEGVRSKGTSRAPAAGQQAQARAPRRRAKASARPTICEIGDGDGEASPLPAHGASAAARSARPSAAAGAKAQSGESAGGAHAQQEETGAGGAAQRPAQRRAASGCSGVAAAAHRGDARGDGGGGAGGGEEKNGAERNSASIAAAAGAGWAEDAGGEGARTHGRGRLAEGTGGGGELDGSSAQDRTLGTERASGCANGTHAEVAEAVPQAARNGEQPRAMATTAGPAPAGAPSTAHAYGERSLAEREAEAEALRQRALASEDAAESVLALMSQLSNGRWAADEDEAGGSGVLLCAAHSSGGGGVLAGGALLGAGSAAAAAAGAAAGGGSAVGSDEHEQAAPQGAEAARQQALAGCGARGAATAAAEQTKAAASGACAALEGAAGSGSAGVLCDALLLAASAPQPSPANGASVATATPARGCAAPSLLSPPSSGHARLCETSPMSAASPGERQLAAEHAELSLHRVSAVRLGGAHMVDDGSRLATVYCAEAQLGPYVCVAHRRYSHFVALQLELEAAFPRLQLPRIVHELKRGRYTQWNWAPHAPLDAAAVEGRLRLLQDYMDALLGVRELALSPQFARFFWPKNAEDSVEQP